MWIVNYKLPDFKKGIVQVSTWIGLPLLKSGDALPLNIDLRTYNQAMAGDDPPSPPNPDPIEYALTASVSDLTAEFTLTPNGAGKIDYGDGSSPVTWGVANKSHTYDSAGEYTAVFTPTDTNDVAGEVTFTVSDPVPSVTHVLSASVTDLSVTFTVTPNASGTINHGDGGDDLPWGVTSQKHDYATAGDYTAVYVPNNANDLGSEVTFTVTEPAKKTR